MISNAKISISVIIPMYNEAENVQPFILEVHGAVSKICENFEIIVIDDGSTDSTQAKLQELKHLSQLRIVRHRKNFGQSAGIISGVRAAKLEWVVTLDGDGQNDPADIEKLIAAMQAEVANKKPMLIIGNRTTRKDHWLRKLSSRIANGVRAKLLKDDCTDTGCGLKLFRREDFLMLPHFNHLHRFLPALYRRMGGEVLNIPVNHRPRLRGQSKYGVMNRLWVGIVDIFGVIWLIRRPCSPVIDQVDS